MARETCNFEHTDIRQDSKAGFFHFNLDMEVHSTLKFWPHLIIIFIIFF